MPPLLLCPAGALCSRTRGPAVLCKADPEAAQGRGARYASAGSRLRHSFWKGPYLSGRGPILLEGALSFWKGPYPSGRGPILLEGALSFCWGLPCEEFPCKGPVWEEVYRVRGLKCEGSIV